MNWIVAFMIGISNWSYGWGDWETYVAILAMGLVLNMRWDS